MQVKRLLKKILIFLLPFVMLFGVFFCFETYDYFGLQKNPEYQIEPLSAMRAIKTKRPTKIILGDSRMANLDVEYINELTGEEYTRLAYGGAQLGESIEMFWLATKYCKLEKVVFGINFYTSKGTQIGNVDSQFQKAVPYANNVFKFATNMNYWLKALAHIKQAITNPIYIKMGLEDRVVKPENPPKDIIIPNSTMGEKWRLNMEVYADSIQLGMQGYDFQDATYEALQEVIDYCNENNISLIFVFPPVHDVIYERCVEVNDMWDDLREIKQFLYERASVYDFEIRSDFTAAQDTFYDGFHLMLENKRLFARLLFSNTDEHPELVDRYIKDGVAIIPSHLEMEHIVY